LLAFPEIKHADEVLILNDSNAGPFGSLKETLRSMRNSPFDITGITDSLQIRYHIQSYFMHFKNGTMQKDEMWEFWSNIRHQDDKQGVIHAYELGLTSRAQSSGLFVGALYPWNLITDYWENPTIHGAERLIDLGLPFVKREILRNSSSKEIEKLKLMISNKFELDLLEIQKFFSNAD
jgi:lipopolysaccharide biosynthesis protein